MIQKLKNILAGKERFIKSAAILTVTSFASYIIGLMRDRIFAKTFGVGRTLDLYNASFIIPDLIFNILVSAALSAAFIPMFAGLNANGEKEKANELANTVMHMAVFIIFIFGGLTAIFMPFLSNIIAPGFSPAERTQLVSLTRLMLISPILMAISSSLGAMLISFKRFFAYGISPVLYNLGIIAGTFTIGVLGIYGLVLGTLFGAMLHLLPRLIVILYSPFRYSFKVNLRDKNFLKVIKLMLPKMLGHPVEQFNFLAFTRIATMLAAGSVTAISFARNFQSVPISLFGIAFATAIYPTLAAYAAKSNRTEFLKNFWKAARNILIFTLPSAMFLYFLSDLPIRIFLGGGKLSDEGIFRTAKVLSIFALSIPTESMIALLARTFYALKNTIIPVAFSIINLLISISFAYIKAKTMGITAIPLGFFLGSMTEFVFLVLILRRKIKTLPQSSLGGHS